MRLVLVDDSILILKYAEELLKKNGITEEVLLCHSGEELMNLCRALEVDIILLDIVMANMDGIEVLKWLKTDEKFKAIDVLMLSSLSDKSVLQRCFELGASDFIAKPIDELEFISRVKSAIRKKNYEKTSSAYLTEIEVHNEELKSLNQRLQNTQYQLFQQEKLASVGQLAAGVAHEINNPLSFVNGNVSALKKYTEKYKSVVAQAYRLVSLTPMEELNLQAQQAFKELKVFMDKTDFEAIGEDIDELFIDTTEGLSRVSRIVKGLRNFSRVDQIGDVSSYNLNEGIENTLIITKNEIKYLASVEMDLQELPEITASGGQINQVLLNLLLNAASAIKSRHDESGNGVINIRTWSDDTYIHCTISDNGMGISQEHINNIFNPFFTTKPTGEGTGLGLSISYDIIVKKHKGAIYVDSQPNEGTVFHIKLPIFNADLVDESFEATMS